MYAVETIRRYEDLERLAPEWTELCRVDPRATPFQTPEWGLSWWRNLRRGSLHCLTVRDGDKLVGLAPLYVSRRQLPPLRRLAFLGTGRSDYLDMVANPSRRDEVIPRIVQALLDASSGWDYLDFQQVPPSGNALCLSQVDAVRVSAHPHSACPYLLLGGDDGLAHASTRLRKNLRYSHRRLSEMGEVRYRLATQSTLDVDLQAVFQLHRSRWRSRGLPGVFGSQAVQAFHREVAAGFLERGILRLHVLERDGGVLSVALCYMMNGRAFYYGGGFDPAAATYSPGSLVVGEAIRCAAAEGCVEFDFLRGEEAYKRLWGCRTRHNQRLIAATSGSAAKIVHKIPAIEARVERAGLRVLEHYLRRRR
jgi:CelD/BcsL family acetyltransferase involved in cellulose biosynthesis